MTKLTDGKQTVVITMSTWEGTGYSPDWSDDFFNVGALPWADEEEGIFFVPDISYCVEQANDWKMGVGDYADDAINAEDREVTVTFL